MCLKTSVSQSEVSVAHVRQCKVVFVECRVSLYYIQYIVNAALYDVAAFLQSTMANPKTPTKGGHSSDCLGNMAGISKPSPQTLSCCMKLEEVKPNFWEFGASCGWFSRVQTTGCRVYD